jgi:ABC-type multidrug transport system fused ATPase/permease subunit
VDAKVTVVALLTLFFIYGLIILRTRNILKQNSKFIDSYLDNSIKILRESFGGIREIIIDQTQEVFVKIYQKIEWSMRQAKIRTQVIGASPRFVIEVGCVISLLIIFLGLDHLNESINLNIPFLGVLAFAFQRAFPVMQTGFSSWTQIRGSSEVSREVENLYIRRSKYFENKSNEKISFKREILLDDISFSYPGSSKLTLKSVTLKIKKGSRVGIKGETGSGKTTLIDLLIGLFNPTKGRLLVDGVEITSENRNSWFSHIAHVPQNVYIADSTIAENIAFGVKLEDIDFARLESSIAKSQLSNFVESLPNKYYTLVGEKGAFLSGGQIQRLGIARALYKNAELLIFDESTSALDSQTESNLMKAIKSLDQDLTIIIIAHRSSVLLDCDVIYEITDGHPTLRAGN